METKSEIKLNNRLKKIKAIILDLDNTIYPVSSIGDLLFKSLFQLISGSGEYTGDLNEIKSEIMKRPFQFVADDFSFSDRLKSDGLNLLSELTYNDSMEPFDDYKYIREIPCKKYLVTTGFTKMQQSKILQLRIKNDFERIFIIDPLQSNLTKREIFGKILTDYNFEVEEVLVIGDDLDAEIMAAKNLGIDTILYDNKSEHAGIKNQKTINNFRDIKLHI